MATYSLSKQERLSGEIRIAQLFEKGNSKLNGFPFRFSWVAAPSEQMVPVAVLFVVPKKKIPRANQRNRIRRQLRELYRLNKLPLHHALAGRTIMLSVAYLGDAPLPMKELRIAYLKLLSKLIHELENRR